MELLEESIKDNKQFPEWLQQDLNTMTYDEVMEKWHTTKRELNSWIRKYGLEVKYNRRTRYTKTLVPADSEWDKYTGKKLENYNKFHTKANPKTYYDGQIEAYSESKKECEINLGCNLAKMFQLEKRNRHIEQSIAEYNHMINLLKKCQKNKDYVGFLEECDLYKVPTEKVNVEEILSDDVILGYISQKYGLETGLKVKSVLNNS